jgi:hypothetical protein
MTAYYSTTLATNPRAETALFKNREDADLAYEWLLKYGYSSDEIHLLMSEETRRRYHYPEHVEPEATEEDTIKGLETGAAVGGGIGATLGIIAAVGAMVIIPGMGLAVAGPLAASLAGAGGLVGSALGALYGSSVPEEKAQELELRIRDGGILIGVVPHNKEEAASIEAAMRERGGEIIRP